MREALTLAATALEEGELPIGAVVVLDGRFIAAAHTREVAERRLLVHAELLALEAADRLDPFPGRRRDAKLFVNLEPCLMCMGAAVSFRLGEIYFGLESPEDGATAVARQWRGSGASLLSYRVPEVQGGILRRESIELFRQYGAIHPSGAKAEWARTLAAVEERNAG